MNIGLDTKTFAGVTVVDFSRLYPGPFCTMLLADLGARVIKIEAPSGGDYARWYPPLVDDDDDGYGAFFEAINRGKESVAVDVRDDSGRKLVERLLGRADVVVESFRPGVMERLGLGVDALREINPQLVIARISGFGQTGPMSGRAGHDLTYLARAGVLGQSGPADGPPSPSAVQIADLAGGGLYAAFGIAAALYRRTRSGRGTVLDISMTEGALSLIGTTFGTMTRDGEEPPRGGGMLNGGLPAYRCYETSDGRYIALAALEPKFWSGFCQAVERPDLLDAGHTLGSGSEESMERIAALFRTKTYDEWTALLAEHDTCTEPVLSLAEVLEDAHLAARDAFDEHEGARWPRPPTSPQVSHRPAPKHGADTASMARELGLSDDELRQMAAAGVIAGSDLID